MIRISGSGWQWQGSRGRFEGEVEKQPPSPVLQRGLAAEDNLQVLAVELSRLSQGHDALSVAGELLDIHFLGAKPFLFYQLFIKLFNTRQNRFLFVESECLTGRRVASVLKEGPLGFERQ